MQLRTLRRLCDAAKLTNDNLLAVTLTKKERLFLLGRRDALNELAAILELELQTKS